MSDNQPVLLFDGECNLCNGLVQFIITHDKKKLFYFATLQSEIGKNALSNATKSNTKVPESLILLYKGRFFVKSSAAIHTAKLLGGFWQLFFAAILVPAFLRDGVYNFISRNRYKWFGKQNECIIPTPELKERFLN